MYSKREGKLLTTRDKCPLCGAPAAEARPFVTTAKGYDLYECRGCGLVYGLVVPGLDELAAIYDDDYARGYERPEIIKQNRAYADRFFSPGHRIPGRVLEIGCGTGHFLRRLREYGHDVLGVEASPALARYAWDLPVIAKPFEELPAVAADFDYVVTFHVLEHIADPLAFARKVATLLRRGGTGLNYMPNVRAWKPDVHGPGWIHFSPRTPAEHINFFDEKTIRGLFEKAGLAITGGGAQDDDFWVWYTRRDANAGT